MPSLEDSPEIEDIFYPPALEDLVYDRALTIATITDYYTFLTKMYMKESQIIHPPPEGWPTIINANPVLLKSEQVGRGPVPARSPTIYTHFGQ